jgi:hypothetical protein
MPSIEANIMDGSDKDFCRVRTGASDGQPTARVDNDTTALHPGITALDGNRQRVPECYSDEAVAT